jgi:hypothetical protein
METAVAKVGGTVGAVGAMGECVLTRGVSASDVPADLREPETQ